MKYIHLNWLENWLNSKRTTREGEYFYSIIWQTISCELWKQDFKDSVYYKDKTISLLHYRKPEAGHYVVLQALNTEVLFEERVKLFHVFDFKKLKSLIVGRGHTAHAKISDISISRVHAQLKIINNEIWIKDENSKFGCLVLQREPYTIDTKSPPLFVQIGRFYFEIKAKSISKYWRWILNPSKVYEGEYFEDYPENYPSEIHKLYYLKEEKLLKVLQDSYFDHNDLFTANEKYKGSFVESPRDFNRNEWREDHHIEASMLKLALSILILIFTKYLI